jgi:hypothetical protein
VASLVVPMIGIIRSVDGARSIGAEYQNHLGSPAPADRRLLSGQR